MSNLTNSDDYLNIIKNFIGFPEIKTNICKRTLWWYHVIFLGKRKLIVIVQKLLDGNTNNIPNEITNMVPFLGPLHVSLNTRETRFLKFHPFFNQLQFTLSITALLVCKKKAVIERCRYRKYMKHIKKIYLGLNSQSVIE